MALDRMVGQVYLSVHATGKGLDHDVRRIGENAGDSYAEGFDKELEASTKRSLAKFRRRLADAVNADDFEGFREEGESVRRTINRMNAAMKKLRDEGHLTSDQFDEIGESLQRWHDRDHIAIDARNDEKALRRLSRVLGGDLNKALATGSFERFAKDTETARASMNRLSHDLKTYGRQAGLSKQATRELRGAMQKWVSSSEGLAHNVTRDEKAIRNLSRAIGGDLNKALRSGDWRSFIQDGEEASHTVERLSETIRRSGRDYDVTSGHINDMTDSLRRWGRQVNEDGRRAESFGRLVRKAGDAFDKAFAQKLARAVARDDFGQFSRQGERTAQTINRVRRQMDAMSHSLGLTSRDMDVANRSMRRWAASAHGTEQNTDAANRAIARLSRTIGGDLHRALENDDWSHFARDGEDANQTMQRLARTLRTASRDFGVSNRTIRDSQGSLHRWSRRAHEAEVAARAVGTAVRDGAHWMDVFGKRTQRTGRRGYVSLLQIAKALAAFLPALVPLGAAVIGLAAGLAAMGAAGVAAFFGIRDAMKKGTALGKQYTSMIDGVKTKLMGLSRLAAVGVFSGLDRSAQSFSRHMKDLIPIIGNASSALGKTFYATVDATLNLFAALSPVLDMVEGSVVSVAQSFQSWTKSEGVQNFVQYLLTALPQAGHFLSSFASAIKNIVVAAAPIGGTILMAITALSDAISAIPTRALSALLTVIVAVKLSFLAWRGISAIVLGVGGAITRLVTGMRGLASTGAAVSGLTQLRGALKGAVAAVGIGIAVWTMWRAKQREAARQQRELTRAIQDNHGALDAQNVDVLKNTNVYKDAVDKVKRYGIANEQITAIALGSKPALDAATAAIKKNGKISVTSSRASLELGRSTKKLGPAAKEALGAISTLRHTVKKSTDEANKNNAANKKYVQQMIAAKQAAQDKKLATISLTEATGNQKKALQQLNAELDQQISKQAQLAGSLTGFYSARMNMIKVLKKSTATTSGNTKAGIKNRQAIDSTVSALQSFRQTQIKNGATQDEATEKYRRNGQQLLKQIAKVDGANSATYKYTKRLLHIPDKVSTRIDLPGYRKAVEMANHYHVKLDDIPKSILTKVQANTKGAIANLRHALRLLNALHNKTIVVTTKYRGSPPRGGPGRHIWPGLMASGGMVTSATPAIIGEAGPEVVVPLNRPLSQVDPSARWLSAIAQGKQNPEKVSVNVPESGSGSTLVKVNMNVSVDDLERMSSVADFMDMLQQQEIDARTIGRSRQVWE